MCVLCTTLSKNQIAIVDSMYRAGHSPEEIAIQVQQSPEAITKHCEECLELPTKEKLQLVLRDLFIQLRLARDAHQLEPGKQSAYAYTAIVREARELASQLESMRSEKDLCVDIINKATAPLVRNACELIVNEMRMLRDEMYSLTSKHDLVDTAIKQATIRVSQTLASLQEEAITTTASLLGITALQATKILTDEERALLN